MDDDSATTARRAAVWYGLATVWSALFAYERVRRGETDLAIVEGGMAVLFAGAAAVFWLRWRWYAQRVRLRAIEERWREV